MTENGEDAATINRTLFLFYRGYKIEMEESIDLKTFNIQGCHAAPAII